MKSVRNVVLVLNSKGGKNNIGPALYNVVGRKVGAASDYKYSKDISAYEKQWTFEELTVI